MKLYGINSYFTIKEFECPCGCGFGSREEDISERLIYRLNDMRKFMNRPLVVTSGARCAEYNIVVGSRPSSAHLPNPNTHQCEAADIAIDSALVRYLFVKLAFYVGFERIGIHDDFVHVDVATHLPEEVLWMY